MVVADSTAIINRAAAALVPETAKVMHSSTQSRIWGTERIMPALCQRRKPATLIKIKWNIFFRARVLRRATRGHVLIQDIFTKEKM
jgi:hypothetical protein